MECIEAIKKRKTSTTKNPDPRYGGYRLILSMIVGALPKEYFVSYQHYRDFYSDWHKLFNPAFFVKKRGWLVTKRYVQINLNNTHIEIIALTPEGEPFCVPILKRILARTNYACVYRGLWGEKHEDKKIIKWTHTGGLS